MKNLVTKNACYLFGVLFFVVLGAIVLSTTSKEEVSLWVNARHARWADMLILCFDRVGTVWFNMMIAIILFMWKGWKAAVQALACFMATLLVVSFFKYVLFPGTLRPVPYFEGRAVLRLVEGVVQLQTESFPSGHTAAAFSIATVLAFMFSGKRSHWILAVLAALVGYGRIYLSQHFITDVYAGMIIGAAVSFFAYMLVSELFGAAGKKDDAADVRISSSETVSYTRKE
jgi:membrane-associated phospholipid phosphatase